MPETPAAAAVPTATAPKPVELAPEGLDCPHCGARLKLWARYERSVEYACPNLKDEPPVLADKYNEWRDLYLKSRASVAQ